MFDDIGQKIKTIAKIGCFAGMVIMAIYGLVFMFTVSFFGGLLIAVLGAAIVYASSFTLYGFGELVESAMVLRDAQLKKQVEQTQASTSRRSRQSRNQESSGYSLMQMATQRETQSSSGWRCQKCGKSNTSTALFCTDCGADR